MRKNRLYFYIVVAVAAVFGIILLYAVLKKEREEEEIITKNDRVEKVENLLSNSSFEKGFGQRDWGYKRLPQYEYGFDNIIKYMGEYSFNINFLQGEEGVTFIEQRITNVELDKKISLLGFIKSEDCDSARFEIEFFRDDSLLVKGYSNSVKGTTDWEEQNAWIKTYTPDQSGNYSVLIKGSLYGKGRVWFDNVRVYSIPVDESIYNLRFDRILN